MSYRNSPAFVFKPRSNGLQMDRQNLDVPNSIFYPKYSAGHANGLPVDREDASVRHNSGKAATVLSARDRDVLRTMKIYYLNDPYRFAQSILEFFPGPPMWQHSLIECKPLRSRPRSRRPWVWATWALAFVAVGAKLWL